MKSSRWKDGPSNAGRRRVSLTGTGISLRAELQVRIAGRRASRASQYLCLRSPLGRSHFRAVLKNFRENRADRQDGQNGQIPTGGKKPKKNKGLLLSPCFLDCAEIKPAPYFESGASAIPPLPAREFIDNERTPGMQEREVQITASIVILSAKRRI